MQCPFNIKPRWERRKDARPSELVAAALELFVERGYAGLDPAQRAAFERLLTLADAELQALLQGENKPTDPELARLVAIIRRHADPRA